MKKKFIDYFMKVAEDTANLSYAKKLKVGSVIVKDNRILLCGYNGSQPGMSNILEDILEDGSLKTRNYVSHSEENIIIYAARKGIALEDTILFCTHLPCPTCSRLIIGAGIKTVYYKNIYRDNSGLDFLKNYVEVIRYE